MKTLLDIPVPVHLFHFIFHSSQLLTRCPMERGLLNSPIRVPVSMSPNQITQGWRGKKKKLTSSASSTWSIFFFTDYSNGGNKNGHQYTNKAYTADQNLDTAFTKTSAVDEKNIDLSVSPNLSERKEKSPMESPSGSVKSDLLFVQWADEHKRSIAFNPSPIGSIRSSKVPYSAPFK